MTRAQACLAFLAVVASRRTASAEPQPDPPPDPDTLFAHAKAAWRARIDAPFVTYALRERYVWRDRVHDNWWQAAFRQSDGALALRRIVVVEEETARLRGMPIRLNVHLHTGMARADSLDTNADADAFPILDPRIDPNSSFGLTHPIPSNALATPSPAPQPAASVLRELARVEASVRDYRIAFAGSERVNDRDAYHLSLEPLREPRIHRLRDLWIDRNEYRTLRIAVAGLFDGDPFVDARWIVSFVDVGGYRYIARIVTDDTLRFGIDRFVTEFAFDFVQYAFPATIPDLTFARFL